MNPLDSGGLILVAAKKEGEDKGVFVRANSNLGLDSGGFEYKLRQTTINTEAEPDSVKTVMPIDTTYVAWGDPIEGTAGEILGDVEDEGAGSALDDAVGFLRDILSDGELPQKEIESGAQSEGFSFSTIKRAKKKLGVKSRKDGKGGWVWSLPDSQNFGD